MIWGEPHDSGKPPGNLTRFFRFQSVHQAALAFPPRVLQITIHIGAHRPLPSRDGIHVAIDFGHVPGSFSFRKPLACASSGSSDP